MYQIHPDFSPHRPVSFARLWELADKPVIQTQLIDTPVIIDSFALIKNGGAWFLRVRGKQGEEGIAPCSGQADYFYPILQKKLLPGFLNRDARGMEKIFPEIFVQDLNYKIQGLAWWCCVAWAESALLDMLGKRAGVNVTDLIGRRFRNELELYVASGNRHTTPEEEVDILQKRVDETGVKAIKFKLGGRMSRNADSLEGRTEGILRLARKHFGDGMIIHSDGNGSFDAAKGIEVGKIVESINGYFYEEPCPFDDLWDTRAVADALGVPLAFGEQETSLRRFAWIIEHDAAQVLQPDIQYSGGFIQCIKVARMAEAAGKPVTPHVSGGYPAYNTLLYNAVIPNAGHYHEYKHFKGVEDCVPGGLTVKDGRVRIPEGPGLGLDLGIVNKSGAQVIFDLRS
jgi:L-alanine-DL-glutamate epimerase-like enolase superfamily enzyme